MLIFFWGTIIGFIAGIPIGAVGAFWLHCKNRECRLYEMEQDQSPHG